MSKSILVIDTPEKCNLSCPCFDIESGKLCNVMREKAEYWNCLLKPLPKKIDMIEQISKKKMKRNLRAQGWNACIDEILKGANGND